MDLLFYHKEVICHLIDRCTRWHAACILKGNLEGKGKKTTESLLDAVFVIWLAIFGPPQFLYVDGESGIINKEAIESLKKQGTEVKTRAPKQHAQFIERRGAILRHSMHTT